MAASHDASRTSARAAPDWSALLSDAVNKPGVLSDAYQRFWHYSVGNQLIALFECHARKLEPGPINTFRGWLKLGRYVKKGERAISLCMPVTVKRKQASDSPPADDGAERPPEAMTVFIVRPRWFVLCQTEGDEYTPPELPSWSCSAALQSLAIEQVTFRHLDGNAQGYALDRQIAVSPVASLPLKTTFHELAHVMLGHTAELGRMDDHESTPRNLREVEAESVALICCESLGVPGTKECRGYIQHWLGDESIPARSSQKIFRAADAILKAGIAESTHRDNP